MSRPRPPPPPGPLPLSLRPLPPIPSLLSSDDDSPPNSPPPPANHLSNTLRRKHGLEVDEPAEMPLSPNPPIPSLHKSLDTSELDAFEAKMRHSGPTSPQKPVPPLGSPSRRNAPPPPGSAFFPPPNLRPQPPPPEQKGLNPRASDTVKLLYAQLIEQTNAQVKADFENAAARGQDENATLRNALNFRPSRVILPPRPARPSTVVPPGSLAAAKSRLAAIAAAGHADDMKSPVGRTSSPSAPSVTETSMNEPDSPISPHRKSTLRRPCPFPPPRKPPRKGGPPPPMPPRPSSAALHNIVSKQSNQKPPPLPPRSRSKESDLQSPKSPPPRPLASTSSGAEPSSSSATSPSPSTPDRPDSAQGTGDSSASKTGTLRLVYPAGYRNHRRSVEDRVAASLGMATGRPPLRPPSQTNLPAIGAVTQPGPSPPLSPRSMSRLDSNPSAPGGPESEQLPKHKRQHSKSLDGTSPIPALMRMTSNESSVTVSDHPEKSFAEQSMFQSMEEIDGDDEEGEDEVEGVEGDEPDDKADSETVISAVTSPGASSSSAAGAVSPRARKRFVPPSDWMTVEELVNYMASTASDNIDVRNCFLLTMGYFTKPQIVLDCLLKQLETPPPVNPNNPISATVPTSPPTPTSASGVNLNSTAPLSHFQLPLSNPYNHRASVASDRSSILSTTSLVSTSGNSPPPSNNNQSPQYSVWNASKIRLFAILKHWLKMYIQDFGIGSMEASLRRAISGFPPLAWSHFGYSTTHLKIIANQILETLERAKSDRDRDKNSSSFAQFLENAVNPTPSLSVQPNSAPAPLSPPPGPGHSRSASTSVPSSLAPTSELSASVPSAPPVPEPARPYWVPDDQAPSCKICRASFSILNRRHHCRLCGQVVCSSCSENRLALQHQNVVMPPTQVDGAPTPTGAVSPAQPNRTHYRVCDGCFLSDKKNRAAGLAGFHPMSSQTPVSNTPLPPVALPVSAEATAPPPEKTHRRGGNRRSMVDVSDPVDAPPAPSLASSLGNYGGVLMDAVFGTNYFSGTKQPSSPPPPSQPESSTAADPQDAFGEMVHISSKLLAHQLTLLAKQRFHDIAGPRDFLKQPVDKSAPKVPPLTIPEEGQSIVTPGGAPSGLATPTRNGPSSPRQTPNTGMRTAGGPPTPVNAKVPSISNLRSKFEAAASESSAPSSNTSSVANSPRGERPASPPPPEPPASTPGQPLNTTAAETAAATAAAGAVVANMLNQRQYQMRMSNKMSCWVTTEILSCPNDQLRRKMLQKWIKVANICYSLNNFNTLFEIMTGIGHNSVYRLKDLFEGLPANIITLYEQLCDVVHYKNNYRTYRAAVKEAKEKGFSVIPFFGVMLRDVVAIEEGGAFATVVDLDPNTGQCVEVPDSAKDDPPPTDANGPIRKRLVNFGRCRQLSRLVLDTLGCCSTSSYSDIKPNISLQQRLLGGVLSALDEKALDDLSYEIKPRRARAPPGEPPADS